MFDWAVASLPDCPDATPPGWSRWLLVRRALTRNAKGELELAYYLCCAPAGTRTATTYPARRALSIADTPEFSHSDTAPRPRARARAAPDAGLSRRRVVGAYTQVAQVFGKHRTQARSSRHEDWSSTYTCLVWHSGPMTTGDQDVTDWDFFVSYQQADRDGQSG